MEKINSKEVVHTSLKVDVLFLRTVLTELVFKTVEILLSKEPISDHLRANGRKSQDLLLLLMLTNKVMPLVLLRLEQSTNTTDQDGKDFQEEPRTFVLDLKELSGSLEPTLKEVVMEFTR